MVEYDLAKVVIRVRFPAAAFFWEGIMIYKLREGDTILEKYCVCGRLGKTNLNLVYDIVDTSTGEHRVLKFPLLDDRDDKIRLSMATNEAKMIHKLSHPHIVEYVSHGDLNGVPYLIREKVSGWNLDECRIADERLRVVFGGFVISQVVDALIYLHSNSRSTTTGGGESDSPIVHGEIAHKNILISRDIFAKLNDFGLATGIEDQMGSGVQRQFCVYNSCYVSPERLDKNLLTPASDIFSLGAVLYYAITGVLAFEQNGFDTEIDILARIRGGTFTKPSTKNKETPERLEKLIVATLEKTPKNRPSASDMKSELQEVMGSPSDDDLQKIKRVLNAA